MHLAVSKSSSSQRIEVRLRQQQREIMSGLRRFNVLLAHRRFGKTVLAIVVLMLEAMKCKLHRPQVAYYCPTYSQAKRVAWPYLRDFCSAIPGTIFNEAELKATLPNGATIQLGSADNPDASRGIYLDYVVLDEPAQMPPRMWFEVLRPALSDRIGGCLMIGTPAGRHGLFYESYENAAGDPEWWRGRYRASETGIVAHSELLSAQKAMSHAEYQQEFECSFDAAIKGAYYAEAMNAADIAPYAPVSGLKTHIAMDLGMNDATACWFFQVEGNRPLIHSYAEYTNMGLPDIVADWRVRGHLYGKVIAPHDIAVRSLSTGQTRLHTLQQLGVDVIVAPNLPVIDGIDTTRALIPRCRFDSEGCREGIEALRQYRSDWQDKKGVLSLRPLHDWTSHAADAMRYLAVTGLAALGDTWSNDLDYSQMDRALCA
jgi:phage terminase large subunit